MKAILIPVRPKELVNILNGDATLLIRKDARLYRSSEKFIQEYGYVEYLLYCTKHNNYKDSLYEVCEEDGGGYGVDYYVPSEPDFILNGKVVAKFTVKKVEEIECAIDYDHECGRDCTYHTDSMCQEVLGERSCLYNDIDEYLDWKPDNIVGYAYHIEDLVIFDKPKELSEFHTKTKINELRTPFYPRREGHMEVCVQEIFAIGTLTKAPQNFCYVESEE